MLDDWVAHADGKQGGYDPRRAGASPVLAG